MFRKPLEEMTDEELRQAYKDASDAVGFVEDGWAMEPPGRMPTVDEVNSAHEEFNAVFEEMERRKRNTK